MNRDDIFIDGEFRRSSSDARIDVTSPANLESIGSVPDAGIDDVDAAVAAARRAFDGGPWPRLPIAERAAIMERAFALLDERMDEIATMVTSEMGLALTTSKAIHGLGSARYFVDVALKQSVNDLRETSYGPALVVKEPVGVVGAIAPWNGPFYTAMLKIAPALITGCTVVFKSAPESPLDAYPIFEAFQAAGLPAGVLNYVTGGVETGRALVAHRGIDMVSFTGSAAAGRDIGRECGAAFRRMQLELGGKSAAILLDDGDLDVAMAAMGPGIFFLTGQTCSAFSRLIVPRNRADEVADALTAVAKQWIVGDPFAPETTMGPLASKRQQERVLGYIESGLAEGATITTGGGVPQGLEHGAYIEPTVFTNVTSSMRIAREEIFGPVASILTYDSVDEAIAIANDSEYGLHGGVFTTDPERGLDVARRIRAGTFSINSYTYNTEAPFGGVKGSGVGRDTGPEGVDAFYELKTINLDASLDLPVI